MTHVLVELYCLKETDFNIKTSRPTYCLSPKNVPTYECLRNGCPFLDFTSCENTLCYIDEKSEMDAGISFGGEMLNNADSSKALLMWRNIALEEIDMAYERYMQLHSQEDV